MENILEIREAIHQKLIIKGNKKEIVEYIRSNFPMYNVGHETTLKDLAYVIQPNLKLYRKEGEIYSF